MVKIVEYVPRIRDEHSKYIRYFEDNNGRNLQKIEQNLVLFRTFIKCDLSCFNKDDSAVVIVEIKSELEDADCSTFGQILCYMTEAEKIDCVNENKVKTVRGIILARYIHENLKKIVKKYIESIPISLKEYRWSDDKQSKELIIRDV